MPMKRIASVAILMLLTLTSCNADSAADGTDPLKVTVPDDGAERLVGDTYSHMLMMSRWVPNQRSTDSVEGTAYIKVTDPTTDRDIKSYTPDPFGFDIPSIDTDEWFTDYVLIDDGLKLQAGFGTKADPADGHLECAILSLETGVVVDFQTSEHEQENSVYCYAFLYDDHNYEPGVPLVQLPIEQP